MNQTQQNVYNKIEHHYRFKRLGQLKKARQMLGNMGGDAIQEGYTNALQYWKSYEDDREFDFWIDRILFNAIRKTWSIEKRHGAVDSGEIDISGLIPRPVANPLSARELSEAKEKIAAYPANQAYILRLALLKGFTTKEISDIVYESKSNIRTIIHRFRSKWGKKFRR